MSEEKDLTVKAKAETPCACACAENLSEYVLSVDFVNALQNIRNMINNAITNVDLKAILNKLIIEINARLQNVWKHFMEENGGVIEEDNITLAKQKLQTIEKKVGRTIVLSYIKAKTGEDGQPVSKRYNDLYVCLPTIRPANATINEALETNETHPLAWIKIISDDFVPGDDPDDVDLDDILRKLEEFEKRLNEIIDIIRSIWAYLCKNWWEFVDAVENQTDENKIRENPNIAQNYYDKRDKNIYVFLKTAKATTDIGEPTEAAWIPLLNAENIPYYQNAWRHTRVVAASVDSLGVGEFIGETRYWLKDSMVYVWLPTTAGEPGGSPRWFSIITGDKNAWRHTEVLNSPPTVNGTFIGQTVCSTQEENITEKPKGDVFVWLPSAPGKPGTDLHWVNITRNKEINDIKNYVPEYVKYNFTKTDVINPFLRNSLDLGRATVGGTIERNGIMVNFNFKYNMYGGYTQYDDNSNPNGEQNAIHHMHDYRTGGAGIYRNRAARYFGLTSPWTQIGLNKMQLLGKITSSQREEARSYVNLSNIRTVLDKNNRSHSINSNQAIQYFVPSIAQHSTVSMNSYSFITTDTTTGQSYKFKWGGDEHGWGDTWAHLMELVTWNRLKQIPQNLNFSDANVFWQFLQLLWDDSNNTNGRQGFEYTKNMDISANEQVDAKGGFISTSTFDILTSGVVREGSTKNEISDNYWMRKNYAVDISVSWPGRAVTDPIVVN